MGDLSAAKRNLNWVKDAVSSARWDNYESSLNKVEQALEGVPDAEKAPVVAELTAIKQEAERAMKAEKAKRVLRNLDIQINAIDPRSLVDSALISKIGDVLKRLASEEITGVVEPSVIATYRAKVEAMLPASAPAAAKPAPQPAPAPAAARPAEKPAPQPAASAPRPAPAPAAAAPAAPSVDLSGARRDLRWVKDALESRDWGRAADYVSRVESALEGVPDAAKAELVAELAPMKKAAEDGPRAEKANRLTDELDRRLQGADPQYNGPDRVRSMLREISERLESDEVQRYLDADAIAKFRARIASIGGAWDAGEKSRYLDKINALLGEFDEGFGDDPFEGRDDMEARRAYQTLASKLTGARNNHQSLPASDADAKRLGAQLDALQEKLDGAWGRWEQTGAVSQLREDWLRRREELSGWDAEREGPSWEAFSTGYEEGLSALNMPQSRRAISACTQWLEHAEETREKYPDDSNLKACVAEAQKVLATATSKLHQAFERLMGEAERAPLPTGEREIEKPRKVVQYVSSWFEHTPHLEASEARAKKLVDTWTHHIEELDRLGAELYAKLEVEAVSNWPGIVARLGAEKGFDPNELAQWKGKAVLISGVWNRSGWDFAGDYNFENRIGGVPVAGNWEKHIGAALRDAVERTRKSIDDHKEWDLVAVVQGTGEVKRRTHRELVVKGTHEKIKTESWEPEPCVVVKVIALRAGPVAIGPA